VSAHLCHAHGCKKAVPPQLLMCLKHWRMVPTQIQRLVWQTYRPGQEADKKPSPEYILVQRSAVWAVFAAEGGCRWLDVPEVGSAGYLIGPEVLGSGRLFA
jgi:hypothetical protein